MSDYNEFERNQRESLMALDGFRIAVTPLPCEIEAFDLQSSSKKIEEEIEKLVNDAGIKTLTSEQYGAVNAPGNLGITVESIKSDRGTYVYAVRAYVTQLAVLERDIRRERNDFYPVVTWMSPRLRTGEVSSQLFVSRIIEQIRAVAVDFVEAYKQAQSELQL
ncbi:MAG: hypothetical protein EKK48_28450 [Candidatus Melainabacteria bacterium]|nr:MAG: hypothetical protein EKK48_28450 [Candidatus Melainabacteria bacterium]